MLHHSLQATSSRSGPIDPRGQAFVEAFSGHLLRRALLGEEALHRARRAQEQSRERFDLVLTRLGLLPETELTQALADFLGLSFSPASALSVAPDLLEGLDPALLDSHRFLPLSSSGERLIIAVGDAFDSGLLEGLAFKFDREIVPVLVPATELAKAIATHCGLPAARDDTRDSSVGSTTGIDEDLQRLTDLASEAPVIRLVNDIIARAIESRASDIHLEPREGALHVRFRIDGILHTVETLSPALRPAVTSRIKLMARLDIAERRLPQDGRIATASRGHEIDLRVSSVPTIIGEKIVLRILDRSSVKLEFASLGFAEPTLATLRSLLGKPNGIFLVTGPTGSGKTTTLYTAISTLDRTRSNISTVEDPIEYRLHGINQIQMHPEIGLTFATALRSLLRQDPDIIMVGEIRDLETAQIAVRASLTGHLVLSTVHTNSAAATVSRLLDMGVESYLLATSLTGVLAQRLVRRLCTACATEFRPSDALLDRLVGQGHVPPAWVMERLAHRRYRRPVGCPACRNSGYSGRLCITELLTVTGPVRELVLAAAPDTEIEAAGRREGMTSLLHDGLAKAAEGLTTIDEVLRVAKVE